MATVVQSVGSQSSGSVAALSQTMTVTAGNVIVAMVQSDGGKCTGTGNIADTKLNTYSRIVQLGGDVAIFRALNCAAGLTVITYIPDAGVDYCALSVAEVSGLHASPDDGSTTNTATSTAISTGSITTTVDGVVFGVFSRHAASTIVVNDSHTDILNTGNTYSSVNGAAGYFIATAGSNALLWTGGASNAYKGVIAAFKNSGPGVFVASGREQNRRLRSQPLKRSYYW
jgi:hypothetical protein